MASTSIVDSPKGMNTSVSRNVKGQVVVPMKSPARSSISGLNSTTQLSSSMKKIGGQSQNSFTNDSSRYMDHTKSRKAAWGPPSSSTATDNLTSTMAASSLEMKSTQKAQTTPQTKTMYGSSSAWLMDFR